MRIWPFMRFGGGWVNYGIQCECILINVSPGPHTHTRARAHAHTHTHTHTVMSTFYLKTGQFMLPQLSVSITTLYSYKALLKHYSDKGFFFMKQNIRTTH